MIRVLRLSGRSGEMEPYADTLLRDSPEWAFCSGLRERYKGNKLSALRLFARAKEDEKLRESAIFEMVELVLDMDCLWRLWKNCAGDRDEERRQKAARVLLDQVKSTKLRPLLALPIRSSIQRTLAFAISFSVATHRC